MAKKKPADKYYAVLSRSDLVVLSGDTPEQLQEAFSEAVTQITCYGEAHAVFFKGLQVSAETSPVILECSAEDVKGFQLQVPGDGARIERAVSGTIRIAGHEL